MLKMEQGDRFFAGKDWSAVCTVRMMETCLASPSLEPYQHISMLRDMSTLCEKPIFFIYMSNVTKIMNINQWRMN